MWRFLFVGLGLAGCASAPAEPPERAAATDPQIHATRLVKSPDDFRRAIVGHTLVAPGMELTLTEDGGVIGRQGQVVFTGSWMFRDGLFCHSFNRDVRRADGRRCYVAAVRGDEVLLIPMNEG